MMHIAQSRNSMNIWKVISPWTWCLHFCLAQTQSWSEPQEAAHLAPSWTFAKNFIIMGATALIISIIITIIFTYLFCYHIFITTGIKLRPLHNLGHHHVKLQLGKPSTNAGPGLKIGMDSCSGLLQNTFRIDWPCSVPPRNICKRMCRVPLGTVP